MKIFIPPLTNFQRFVLCLWQDLNLNLLTFCLNLLLCFSFDILAFLSICSWIVIETLNKFHVEIFVKKCELESDKLHSALYNLPLAGTSHIKCIYVFILCTLYSSDHFAFRNFELNGQRQEGNCSHVTLNDTRIWPIEMQNGWTSMCYRNMNFPNSTKFIRQWSACTAILTWHNFCLEESKYFRILCFDIQTNF